MSREIEIARFLFRRFSELESPVSEAKDRGGAS